MTDPAPLISCIVPVYNGARFLVETLDNILAQSWHPLEVVVVDDGSTDATGDLLARYADRVLVIRQANAGPSAARNAGIKKAKGDFVAFQDADDLCPPHRLTLQMTHLAKQGNLGFCVAKAQNFWEPEVADEGRHLAGSARAGPIAGYVTGTLLVRRDVLNLVGPFDPALTHGDSADWFLRADKLGVEGTMLDEVLLFRRLHLNNLSRVSAGDSRDEFFRLLKRNLEGKRRPTPPPVEPTP
jgi:glycosyltransferase involved in cell wall biosynthesis